MPSKCLTLTKVYKRGEDKKIVSEATKLLRIQKTDDDNELTLEIKVSPDYFQLPHSSKIPEAVWAIKKELEQNEALYRAKPTFTCHWDSVQQNYLISLPLRRLGLPDLVKLD